MSSWPGPATFTFAGAYAGQAVPELVLNTSGLTLAPGADPDVATIRAGGRAARRITVHAVPRGTPAAAGTELIQSSERRWLRQTDDLGSGQVDVQNSDPALGSAGYFDLLRFAVDGRVDFTAVVERKVNQALRRGEATRLTRLSGRGALGVLQDGIVEPFFGMADAGYTSVRSFNFASPDYDDSGWSATPYATGVVYTDDANNPTPPRVNDLPARWPDLAAQWLWDRDVGGGQVPGGDCYFRYTFTTAAPCQAEVWAAADDVYELWIDGALIVKDDSGVYLGQSKAVRIMLPAATHTVGVFARNTTPNLKAGALWSVLRLNGVGNIVQVLSRSEATANVKLLAYPPAPPGFTPGKVVRLLLAEAQARGECLGVTLGFTDDADTTGTVWPTTPDVAFPIGTNLLAAVRQLAETYFEVEMTPQLVLNAYATGKGTVTGVQWLGGATVAPAVANVAELTYDGSV